MTKPRTGLEIAVDFDGTCVTHDYPRVGKDIGAIPVLKRLVDNGHRLILFTMRSGKELEDAVQWFQTNDIPLYGVNENPTQKKWTQSPKVYAQIYIDDAALGCPTTARVTQEGGTGRVYVDWKKVEEELEEYRGVFKTKKNQ